MRIEVTLDCNDLERVSRFWSQVLERTATVVVPGRYVALEAADGDGLTLTLQAVPEPKTVKNRMHLDLLVSDVERTAERLRSIGASVVTPMAEDFGSRWYVLADPDGNEFCLAEST